MASRVSHPTCFLMDLSLLHATLLSACSTLNNPPMLERPCVAYPLAASLTSCPSTSPCVHCHPAKLDFLLPLRCPRPCLPWGLLCCFLSPEGFSHWCLCASLSSHSGLCLDATCRRVPPSLSLSVLSLSFIFLHSTYYLT